jgi:hypothetical protein
MTAQEESSSSTAREVPESQLQEKDVDGLSDDQLARYLQQAKEAAMKKQQRSRFKALLRKRNSGNDALEAEPEPKRARENLHSKILVPIITYKGGGAAELTTFLYDLNLRFAFAFTEFRINSSKVVFASACFRNNTKDQ